MTEEKQTEDKKEAVVTEPTALEKVEAATRKLEEAETRLAEREASLKAAKVESQIQGNAEAGIKKEEKEETPEEYKDRVMSGDA